MKFETLPTGRREAGLANRILRDTNSQETQKAAISRRLIRIKEAAGEGRKKDAKPARRRYARGRSNYRPKVETKYTVRSNIETPTEYRNTPRNETHITIERAIKLYVKLRS